MKGVSEALLASLHPLELKVLPHLKDKITLSELVKQTGMQEVEVMRALQWLENKQALSMEAVSHEEITLDDTGKNSLQNNLPEMRLLKNRQELKKRWPSVSEVGSDKGVQEDVFGLTPEEKNAAIGKLKALGLINIEKREGDIWTEVTSDGEEYNTDKYPPFLLLKKIGSGIPFERLSASDKKELDSLKKRKKYILIKEQKDRIVTLTDLGKELSKIDTSKLDFAERVTSEDLSTGKWKEKRYRSFDVTAPVRPSYPGKEHFVQDAMEYVRQIWIEMGFQEMEGDMVQSAFWDLDALFVPQDHPAREMQDTFYLDNPGRTAIPRPVFERIKEVHETGGNTGSLGWRYAFSRDESERLLMRTHTTALSAHTLWKIKEGKLPMPGKYFAIGKCFRNEAVDWKHLFEFHQVEGIVVDPNVTFADFLGYLKTFFMKMGYPNIRIRPSHFPYTEPSVEIDVWNEHRKQWVEFGGAGMFRPEVTKMLLGEEIPVLAWGPGFDRIIVQYFGITDIRDLYKNDIKQMREMRRFMRIDNG